MTSVIVTSSPHEREHLRSMWAPTRALNRIVLSLNKPKGKIEPTKNDNMKKNPFRNYITAAFQIFFGEFIHFPFSVLFGSLFSSVLTFMVNLIQSYSCSWRIAIKHFNLLLSR